MNQSVRSCCDGEGSWSNFRSIHKWGWGVRVKSQTKVLFFKHWIIDSLTKTRLEGFFLLQKNKEDGSQILIADTTQWIRTSATISFEHIPQKIYQIRKKRRLPSWSGQFPSLSTHLQWLCISFVTWGGWASFLSDSSRHALNILWSAD